MNWHGTLTALRMGSAAAALLAASLLAGAASAQDAPKEGGTLIAAIGGDPAAINANISIGVNETFSGCIIYEGLIRFGEGLTITPGLAKSWDISDDKLTYTFHLVDAKWHDGQPLTAEDVKFSLLEVSKPLGPKFAAAGRIIEDIQTPDPKTVVIKIANPFGPFLFSLACEQNAAIMPAHVFRGKKLPEDAVNIPPVGTGPFKFDTQVSGDRIEFVKNEDYWREGEPHLDKVILKVSPDTSARVLALRSGDIDFVIDYYFPTSAVATFKDDPKFLLSEASYPNNELVILNTKKAPLDKPEVRQALMVALDRNFVQRSVFQGIGGPGTSAIDSRLTWAHNPAVDYNQMYAYDPARAEKMLDDAGLPKGADGKRFQLRLVYDTGRPEYTPMAQTLSTYWEAIGVDVVLEGADRPVVLNRVFTNYDFDGTLMSYTTSGDPALGIARLYVSESIKQGQNFNNAAQYSNAEVDRLFTAGRDAATQEERAKHYFAVQEILAKDLPVLTYYEPSQIQASTVRLKNLTISGLYPWWGSLWLAD